MNLALIELVSLSRPQVYYTDCVTILQKALYRTHGTGRYLTQSTIRFRPRGSWTLPMGVLTAAHIGTCLRAMHFLLRARPGVVVSRLANEDRHQIKAFISIF